MTSTTPTLLDPRAFDGAVDGRPVVLAQLASPGGLRAGICNLGARLLQLVVPGRDGRWHDVVLGHDSLAQLQAGLPSMGAFIGRYANRIGNARFTLGGREHRLPANDGPHCLHGGPGGSRWRAFEVLARSADRVELGWTFREADDGFPGTLELRVAYALHDPGTLSIEWEARALDADTVASFAAHPFFNLEGQGSAHARDQRVEIDAERWLPVDAGRIPTGEIAPVAGTAFDLRAGATVGEAIARLGGGFDHCYVPAGAGALRRVARAASPATGVAMEVWSDAPGLQFYTASALDGSLPRHAGKGGRAYGPEAGFCLEPQELPDAPNQPGFPSPVLRAGQARAGRVEYRFGVDAAGPAGA